MFSLQSRRRNRIFRRPTELKSVPDSGRVQSSSFAPLRERKGLAVACNAVIVASVAYWRRSHVGNEILVRLNPSFAHCDSATAIPLVVGVGRIHATPDHFLPNKKCWDMGLAMRCSGFKAQATAAFRFTVFQLFTSNDFGCATFAAAQPSDFSSRRSCRGTGSQN